ncbi:MAG: hypothetical protein HQK65_14710 [Desulfamplus sp.]|nr:hypothetical protein [Desulfamplus sp.]
MKATYKHLKEDWDRWQQGMNCPTDSIPPMFVYACNCCLERCRMEEKDEHPKPACCGKVPESESDRHAAAEVPESVWDVFQSHLESR